MFVTPSAPYAPFASVGKALYIRERPQEDAAATSAAARSTDLRELTGLTQRLRRATERLGSAIETRRVASGAFVDFAFARSRSALSISVVETAAELKSTAEINSVATSFTPREPGFAGGSSTDPLIGGVYDGAQGDDTLTFTVTSGGVVGVTPVELEIRDSGNQLVDTLTFGIGYSAGTEVTASNGLTLALGNGTAQLNDSFTVDVFASVGGVVDTTSAFNGTGNSDPNFDPGVSVGAGSFEVNGVTIDVKANDSIDKVLGKINSSAAGVTALFDAATERLVLTQETPGSAATITVGNDTSGFLAATKLDLATVVAGTDDERTLAIGDVAAFAGISSGTFSINGVQLTVDVLNDSLNDLIARIDASGAGADAAFDAATGRFSLTATTTAALTLSDGTSGLFTGLDVLATTYQPERDESPAGIAFRDGAKVRSRLDEFGEALDDLLRATLGEEVEPAVTAVRDRLREAFVGAFDGDVDDEVFSSAGIRFDFDRDASRAFDLQRPSLRLSMERDASGVFTLLAGGRKGLVARLDDAFRDLDRTLRDFATEDTGSLVDRSA